MTITKWASLARCAEIAGLQPQEMLAGVSPTQKHERMFLRYRREAPAAARVRLVAEIRDALAAGSLARAADLLILLRWLLALPEPALGSTVRRRRRTQRLARTRWRRDIPALPTDRDSRGGVVTPLFEGAKPRR